MKFSIILPTYNRADTYLKDAIDSVINQTYCEWELLVIDNHSTDNTDELIRNYNDKRIKLLKINNNGIIAKSRNLGLRKASGEYIAFLDSDDHWDAVKLERCSNYLDAHSNQGVCHSEIWQYPHKKLQRYYGRIPFTFENLLKIGNLLSLSSTIVHSKILDDLDGFDEDEKIITAEDYDLWIRLAKKNYVIGFLRESLGTFRIHTDSESSNIDKNISAICNVIIKHAKDSNVSDNERDIAISNAWQVAGKSHQNNSSRILSLKSYLESLKYNYLNIRSYLLILSLCFPYEILKDLYRKNRNEKNY